jgi:hypothetical protein
MTLKTILMAGHKEYAQDGTVTGRPVPSVA